MRSIPVASEAVSGQVALITARHEVHVIVSSADGFFTQKKNISSPCYTTTSLVRLRHNCWRRWYAGVPVLILSLARSFAVAGVVASNNKPWRRRELSFRPRNSHRDVGRTARRLRRKNTRSCSALESTELSFLILAYYCVTAPLLSWSQQRLPSAKLQSPAVEVRTGNRRKCR